MNDAMMTIIGNVVDEPRMRVTTNGHKVTTFRVAATSRRYDKDKERYVDGNTCYMSVTSWRAMAENVFASLHKGQPVVVYGRCSTRNYVVNEQPRTSYELEALAAGHDVSRGTTTFERAVRTSDITVATDPEGRPADESDHYLSVVAGLGEPGSVVDPVTGELLEAPEPDDESLAVLA